MELTKLKTAPLSHLGEGPQSLPKLSFFHFAFFSEWTQKNTE